MILISTRELIEILNKLGLAPSKQEELLTQYENILTQIEEADKNKIIDNNNEEKTLLQELSDAKFSSYESVSDLIKDFDMYNGVKAYINDEKEFEEIYDKYLEGVCPIIGYTWCETNGDYGYDKCKKCDIYDLDDYNKCKKCWERTLKIEKERNINNFKHIGGIK